MNEKTTAAAKAKPAEAEGPKPGQFVKEKDKDGGNFVPASEARFMTSVEYKSPLCWYCPVVGTPFEHLLRPEYWASIKKLPINAHVYIDTEDCSYWAELKVLKVGQGFAKVFVLRHIELTAAGADPQVIDGYDIQWTGPIDKHRVLRTKDGHVLKQGLDTWDDASAWLRDYKKMLNN
jgi:hypothetical protein